MRFAPLVEAYTQSKTALIGLGICFMATGYAVFATAVDYMSSLRTAADDGFSAQYGAELFLLYGSYVGVIAGKAGWDNFTQVRAETRTYEATVAAGAGAPQPMTTPPIT